MKKTLGILLLLLALILLFAACGKVEETSGKVEETTPIITTEEAKPLQVTDGYIYDKNGNEVVLKGINLGGWLLQETWMCAVNGAESNSESFAVLKERGFSDEEIATLFKSYADNYITEYDIETIARIGMNCLRIPFWYRNFMTEELAFYTENPDENPGFVYLDRVISWAEKYGIYIILDMHGCPGGQSTDHCCGIIGKNELYTKPENLDAMERLWVAIAQRYRDSEAVCAYDIMNEPMNNGEGDANGWTAGSDEAVRRTNFVYNRMIKAIRKVDPKHIITVEGIWSTDVLPDPAEYGWTNMMYQLHLYDYSAEMVDYRVAELDRVRREYGVAVYAGEFNNGDFQEYAYGVYNEYRISRTAWTYKTARGNQGNWSLYYADIPAADLKNDSYEVLVEKWGEILRTDNQKGGWTRNQTLYTWLFTYSK